VARSLFLRQSSPSLVGVIHLLPLPGAPTDPSALSDVLDRALQDAMALKTGGVDGLILENFGDAPFSAVGSDPMTIAFMTRIACAVREQIGALALGINVLRNDAAGALAVAAASEADFVRINIHTGVMVTDQGLITGQARQTLLQRQRYALNTRIAADVHVKHASPLGQEPFLQSAKDTLLRGHADALIVTGSGTGEPVSKDKLISLKEALPQASIWMGSGLSPDTVEPYRGLFHTAIVGTVLHKDNNIRAPIEMHRVQLMRQALKG
jgi:membrane complex biogenesis BtpA family protein